VLGFILATFRIRRDDFDGVYVERKQGPGSNGLKQEHRGAKLLDAKNKQMRRSNRRNKLRVYLP
jgi:hypothetical protein